jgi:hypothetical protein
MFCTGSFEKIENPQKELSYFAIFILKDGWFKTIVSETIVSKKEKKMQREVFICSSFLLLAVGPCHLTQTGKK